MKVVICGGGQVGYGIAERLAAERVDVSVIDTSADLISRIRDTLDVRAVVGHGAYPEVLAEAGADEADMLIAATHSDEVNIVACEVAHAIFNVPTKIARVRAQAYLRPEYQDLFARDQLPIDVVISPELEVGEMVLRRVAMPGATDVMRFAEGKVSVLAIECLDECPVIHTPLSQLSELFPDLVSVVVGIVREGKLFIPHSQDQLFAGDLAYVVAVEEQVLRTLALFGHDEPPASRIVIVGAGNVGLYAARKIEARQSHNRVKIIEMDRGRALAAAEKLRHAVVLVGSALDQKLLREADIADADLLLALTNNDQVNMLAGVMAKRLGCKSNLVLINDPGYHGFVESLDIDSWLNPRSVTISRVLQHIRRGRILAVYSVQEGGGEVIEAEALETSPLVGPQLRDADLPEGVRIGALIRNGEILRPNGSTRIRAKDRVVVFALADAIKKVEQLFRVSLDYF